jgi:transcriptional regulator with XRE-family HTH domain
LDFTNPLPKRLKEARLREKISQKTLGINIGLEPDLQTLKRIADDLDVPLNYFFCESDDMAAVVMLFHRVSDEKRKRLLSLIYENLLD